MKKYIGILTGLALLTTPATVFAASLPDCQTIYGGGGSCEQNAPVTINKQVQNPESLAFVENLIPTDPQIKGGQAITFKLTITNPTNAAVNNIVVDDIFPPYITYTDGEGTYDGTDKILHITLDQLKSKEVKTFIVKGQVSANTELPNDILKLCVINQARATADNKVSQDNTLTCLKKDTTTQTTQSQVTRGGLRIYPTTSAKSTPKTGPEMLATLSLFPLAAFGFLLRNKAKT